MSPHPYPQPHPSPQKLRPVVLLGPTAGGKSRLALDLARALPGGGQIIGADSMQVYTELNTGTAKPTPTDRRAVPHHLIDLVPPDQPFTVHDWLGRAHTAIADIQAQGQTPIIVGGTNLYLKALLEGLFDGPPRDPAFRATLKPFTPQQLHSRLQSLDPVAADRIAPADRQRLTRALEVHHLTGAPISQLQTQWSEKPDARRPTPYALLGLNWPAEAINPRINRRVKAMFFPDKVEPELAAEVCFTDESLPDEVRRLLDQDTLGPHTPQANEALGYKQLLAHLAPDRYPDRQIKTLNDAFERTKVLTRRFAKQQRTWLKRFREVHWLDAAEMSAEQACESALDHVCKMLP
ncbi:MAG: tRNA (adenosine(37)-N6)-dimethylallyltransferase MiaA [Planctomycetota bacterium]